MIISEAIRSALDDWASSPEFDVNAQVEWLDDLVQDTVEGWMEDNGYKFDETTLEWSK